MYLLGIKVVGAISFSRQSGHSWSSDSSKAPLIPVKKKSCFRFSSKEKKVRRKIYVEFVVLFSKQNLAALKLSLSLFHRLK